MSKQEILPKKPAAKTIVGGVSPIKHQWLAGLWHKLLPPHASPLRRLFTIGGSILAVLALIAGLILLLHTTMSSDKKVSAPHSKHAGNKSQHSNDTKTTTKSTAASTAPTKSTSTTNTTPSSKKGSSVSAAGGTSTSGSSSSSGSNTPSSCNLPNYPSASCTGVPAGTTLTSVSGDVHITTPGAVLDSKDINGCVFVEAPNVTIKRTKISCGFAFAIHSLASDYSGGGLLIQDVEITCGNTSATGVAGYGFTAQRVNVYGCENGFSVDNDVVIEDSYIHDLFNNGSGHTDGIQMGGGSNITYRHNKIFNNDPAGTSAIIGDTGSFSNVLITQNLLAGGGYSLYCAISPGANYVVTDNHFSRALSSNGGGYGPWIHCDNATQTTGNVWDNDGTAVPF